MNFDYNGNNTSAGWIFMIIIVVAYYNRTSFAPIYRFYIKKKISLGLLCGIISFAGRDCEIIKNKKVPSSLLLHRKRNYFGNIH